MGQITVNNTISTGRPDEQKRDAARSPALARTMCVRFAPPFIILVAAVWTLSLPFL